MAKKQKIYSESPEIRAVASDLVKLYYLHLGHVDLETVYFAEIEGEKPERSPVSEISGVSSPWVRQMMAQLGNYRLYCMGVWVTEWEELSPAQREWLVFDALYSVAPSCDGKLRRKDVQEHGIIVELLGGYWRKGIIINDKDLPILRDKENPVPIPVPPDPNPDEGSTLGDDE